MNNFALLLSLSLFTPCLALTVDIDYLEVLRRSPVCKEEYAPGCTTCCPKEDKEPPVFVEGMLRDYPERVKAAIKRGEVRRLSQAHRATKLGDVLKVEDTLAREPDDPLGMSINLSLKPFNSPENLYTAAAFFEVVLPKFTRAEGPPPREHLTFNRLALLGVGQSFAVEFPPEFCPTKVNLGRLKSRPDLKLLTQFFSGLESCNRRRLMVVFSPGPG